MRKVIAAIIVCLLQLPRGALAQDFCQSINLVVSEAAADYANIQGEDQGDNYYASSIVLPGASDCYIDRSDVTAFRCSWKMNSTEEVMASAINFANSIHTCFPQAPTQERQTESGPAYNVYLNDLEVRVSAKTERNRVLLQLAPRNR